MSALVIDARLDESIHVVAIAGAGDMSFCAGADARGPEFRVER